MRSALRAEQAVLPHRRSRTHLLQRSICRGRAPVRDTGDPIASETLTLHKQTNTLPLSDTLFLHVADSVHHIEKEQPLHKIGRLPK